MAQTQMHADHPLILRIRSEFREMPGLCLTPAQASRLWSLDADTTAMALEMLVAAGALTRTADGRFIAQGGDAQPWSGTAAWE